MSQKPDPTKIDAALKRAAYKAIHGTREERSGRFLPREGSQSGRGNDREGVKRPDLAKRKG